MNLELQINSDYELLRKKYSKLSNLNKENYGLSISGEIDIIDPDNGKIWETYTIKIAIANGYPQIMPLLFELSNKIPKNSDRHINGDGSCCLAPPVEQALILGKHYTLVDYIDKLAIRYLAAQKLYDLGEGWINGEYSHYGRGIIEYYKEKFNTKKISVIFSCLRNLIGTQRNRPNSLCFCRSRLKYIHCHKKTLQQFTEIDKALIKNDLIQIVNYFKKIKK